ncbi:unnamed protein product [Phytomonas sp. EM1]|nr:unnamed protein product [Phytomonas sp. EM1]|eukprot:CCW64241.1 unnamed protein product [Phytomonas sp. isolate EM1]
MDNILSRFFHIYNSWLDGFKGEIYKEWMSEHLEVPVFVTILYLVIVLYVPEHVMKHRRPFNLIHLNRAWNLLLTVYSVMGVYYTGIRLFEMFYSAAASHSPMRADTVLGTAKQISEAWYPVVCVWNEDKFFNGPVGFFVLSFILSKLFETIDTVFLVAQKKSFIFLHWYHHVTVMLYGWHAYTNKISSGLVFAVMNYAVHSVMYFYYFLCACGLRRYIRPIAPLITFLQILQMVLGVIIELATYYLSTYSARGCDVSRQNSRLGLVMYLSYLALFVKLFYENYLCRAKDPVKDPTTNGSPRVPRKNGHLSIPSNGKIKGGVANKKNA